MLDGGNQKELGRAMALSQVGLMMAAPAGLGLLLDRWVGWGPWGVIAGAILGLVTGLIQLVRLGNQDKKPGKKDDLKT
jgi:F0F1-type ATP synthase assembly protein I